jgi:hypothetical protein
MVSFTLRPFNPQRKKLSYPLNISQGGLRIPSGRFGEKKNLLPFPGIQTQFLGRPIRCLVTGLAELSQLLQYVIMSHMEYNDK